MSLPDDGPFTDDDAARLRAAYTRTHPTVHEPEPEPEVLPVVRTRMTEDDARALHDRFVSGGWDGRVTVLHDSGPLVSRRDPVPFLRVPADDTCGAVPPVEWRAGALLETCPDAVGVSQCALSPGHPAPRHVGLVFLPVVPGDPDGAFDGLQVAFPDEEQA